MTPGAERAAEPAGIGSFLAVLAGMVAGVCLLRLFNYLLFHTVVEIFTVAVAWSTFFLAWNARRFLDNHYLLLLGIGSLFVGAIDLVHTLAFKGMGIFPDTHPNLATELWVAGRSLQSLVLLAAPLFVRRRLPHWPVAVALTAITGALFASIGFGIFPECYVEGSGLTTFKVAAEYAIIAALLGGGWFLYRRRQAFEPLVFGLLVTAVGLMALAEMMFTLYVDVYGALNMAGHVIRFAADCLVYRAIIVTGVERPNDLLYHNLARSEEALRTANLKLESAVSALRTSDERYQAFLAGSPEGICRIEFSGPVPVSAPQPEQVARFLEHGYLAECNDSYAWMRGRARQEELAGAPAAEVFTEPRAGIIRALVESGYRLEEMETQDTDAEGETRWNVASLTGVVRDGLLVRVWIVERDITERKRAAMERERLIGELQAALAEVRTLSGLLPICANCKKIRDDRGYWNQVENYIGERTKVSFTHGICPDCAKQLYADIYNT